MFSPGSLLRLAASTRVSTVSPAVRYGQSSCWLSFSWAMEGRCLRGFISRRRMALPHPSKRRPLGLPMLQLLLNWRHRDHIGCAPKEKWD